MLALHAGVGAGPRVCDFVLLRKRQIAHLIEIGKILVDPIRYTRLACGRVDATRSDRGVSNDCVFRPDMLKRLFVEIHFDRHVATAGVAGRVVPAHRVEVVVTAAA